MVLIDTEVNDRTIFGKLLRIQALQTLHWSLNSGTDKEKFGVQLAQLVRQLKDVDNINAIID